MPWLSLCVSCFLIKRMKMNYSGLPLTRPPTSSTLSTWLFSSLMWNLSRVDFGSKSQKKRQKLTWKVSSLRYCSIKKYSFFTNEKIFFRNQKLFFICDQLDLVALLPVDIFLHFFYMNLPICRLPRFLKVKHTYIQTKKVLKKCPQSQRLCCGILV